MYIRVKEMPDNAKIYIGTSGWSYPKGEGAYLGADGLPSGVSFVDPYDGSFVAPYYDTNDVHRGGPHGWDNAQADIDGGKVDGFLNQAYKGITADFSQKPRPPIMLSLTREGSPYPQPLQKIEHRFNRRVAIAVHKYES